MLKLKEYQKETLEILLKDKRKIIAEEMGMGKTITVLSALEKLKPKKVLLIAPKNVLKEWQGARDKFFKNSNINLIRIPKLLKSYIQGHQIDEISVFCTNFEALYPKGGSSSENENLKPFDVIVIDESHRIKNRRSKAFKAIKKLSSQYIFLLSGTPMPNKPEEIWTSLNLIDRKKFSSYWKFVYEHCMITNNGFGIQIGQCKDVAHFKESLSPYIVVRKKENYLKLPDKVYTKVYLQFDEKQKEIYEQMRKHMIIEIEGQEIVSAPIVATKLLRLQEITASPEIYYTEEFKGDNPKFKWIEYFLQQHGGKWVIFSNFLRPLKNLKKYLYEDVYIFSGEEHKTVKDLVLKRFKEREYPRILAGTIKSIGIGLNLEFARGVIFLDKTWTPAYNNQAIDRLHRIGRKGDVPIYDLMIENSIDEYVDKVQNDKKINLKELLNISLGKEIFKK